MGTPVRMIGFNTNLSLHLVLLDVYLGKNLFFKKILQQYVLHGQRLEIFKAMYQTENSWDT